MFAFGKYKGNGEPYVKKRRVSFHPRTFEYVRNTLILVRKVNTIFLRYTWLIMGRLCHFLVRVGCFRELQDNGESHVRCFFRYYIFTLYVIDYGSRNTIVFGGILLMVYRNMWLFFAILLLFARDALEFQRSPSRVVKSGWKHMDPEGYICS